MNFKDIENELFSSNERIEIIIVGELHGFEEHYKIEKKIIEEEKPQEILVESESRFFIRKEEMRNMYDLAINFYLEMLEFPIKNYFEEALNYLDNNLKLIKTYIENNLDILIDDKKFREFILKLKEDIKKFFESPNELIKLWINLSPVEIDVQKFSKLLEIFENHIFKSLTENYELYVLNYLLRTIFNLYFDDRRKFQWVYLIEAALNSGANIRGIVDNFEKYTHKNEELLSKLEDLQVNIIEYLVTLKFSEKEIKKYEENIYNIVINVLRYEEKEIEKLIELEKSIEDEKLKNMIENFRKILEEYIKINREKEENMVSNILKIREEYIEKGIKFKAVVICGKYHCKRIEEFLNRKGINKDNIKVIYLSSDKQN